MPTFLTPPLKRHPALQPFSRDHYVGLVQARHLVEAAGGDDSDRRAAVAAFLDAWDTEIAQHFDYEERLLIPLAPKAGRSQLRREHRRIRALVSEARKRRKQIDPGDKWVRTLGQLLNDHIRWEEREFYPAIESAATGNLDALRQEFQRLETSRPRGRGRTASRTRTKR